MCREKTTSVGCDKIERVHMGNHVDTRVFQEKCGKLEQDCGILGSVENRKRSFGEECGRLLHP